MPEQEYLLEPGDMLYLPPHIAHEGTALEECTTWSIGFRAPAARELAATLLDRLELDRRKVAVELNEEIVHRSRYAETALSSGDSLEIVHFIGGG